MRHGDLAVDLVEEVREVDRSQMMPTFEQHEALSQPQLGPGVNGRGASGDHESFQIIRRSRNGRGRQGGEWEGARIPGEGRGLLGRVAVLVFLVMTGFGREPLMD